MHGDIIMSIIQSIVGALAKPVTDIISEVVTDKDERNRIKARLMEAMLEQGNKEMEHASKIIVAEAQSESGAARSWRPHLMYLIMLLLVFNGVAVPIANAIWGIDLPILDAYAAIPNQMWTLLTIGLGGYVGGRSVEKAIKFYKGGN